MFIIAAHSIAWTTKGVLSHTERGKRALEFLLFFYLSTQSWWAVNAGGPLL